MSTFTLSRLLYLSQGWWLPLSHLLAMGVSICVCAKDLITPAPTEFKINSSCFFPFAAVCSKVGVPREARRLEDAWTNSQGPKFIQRWEWSFLPSDCSIGCRLQKWLMRETHLLIPLEEPFFWSFYSKFGEMWRALDGYIVTSSQLGDTIKISGGKRLENVEWSYQFRRWDQKNKNFQTVK